MNNIVETTTNNDFLDYCHTWCDKNNIGTLSNELIEEKSICIPKKGLKVETSNGIFYKYFPILNRKFFDGDELTNGRLGRYNISQDDTRILFIYRNGETYVTRKTKETIYELEANGYMKMPSYYEVYVPLQPGETIVDPELRKKWDNIMKGCKVII